MKRNKPEDKLNNKDKLIYNATFGSAFLIAVLSILYSEEIFHFIMSIKGVSAVIQNENQSYLQYLLAGIWIGCLFLLYNKFYINNIKIKDVKQTIKSTKQFVLVLIIFIVTIIACVFNYTTYDYIDNNKIYSHSLTKNEELLSICDVKIEYLEVDNISRSFNHSGRIRNEFYIKCNLVTEKGTYELSSSDFYGYKAMSDFINSAKCERNFDATKLSELLNQESKDNGKYINSMFEKE